MGGTLARTAKLTAGFTAKLTALMTASGLLAFGASGQYIEVKVTAVGNLPESKTVDNLYLGAQWAAANYQTSAHVSASGHPFDPPHTETFVNATFDQSFADGAVLRADGLARQPYRGNGNNPNAASVGFDLQYSLHIQNLAGVPLNIVLGNDLHGTFGVADFGRVDLTGQTVYFGPSGLKTGSGTIALTKSGTNATGLWANTVSPATVHDVVYSEVVGYQMNSFEYLGQETVGGGQAIDVTVDFQLALSARLDGTDSGGLAMFDFGNTGHLTTKAYDPVTGEDRSSEIRVTMVQTPTPGGAAVLVVAGVGALRRKRSVA